jgi:hypothetical protein
VNNDIIIVLLITGSLGWRLKHRAEFLASVEVHSRSCVANAYFLSFEIKKPTVGSYSPALNGSKQ